MDHGPGPQKNAKLQETLKLFESFETRPSQSPHQYSNVKAILSVFSLVWQWPAMGPINPADRKRFSVLQNHAWPMLLTVLT